ncbi:tyrosine-type recombinase/integrase [Paucibacter sp. B51]|uniref:tyrosine-type recombinase/integrase n=1 Tax=Paucibacter sp. B51 TaxID=2993315 RepID=UPI0022EC16EA|nr:tyrosine-type recombinase/integrase [Paucibacter sp. B51]
MKITNRRCVLVDGQKLPRYWPAVWELFHGAGLASSTLEERLGHIEALYQYTELAGGGCLDDALSELDVDVLSSALESFFISLRNIPVPTSRALKRWNAAFHFVRDTCDRIASNPFAPDRMAELKGHVARLDRLYLGLRPLKQRFGALPRALPRLVLSELLEIARPGNARNPFSREPTQWRAYTLVLLFLLQGLRRGEALTLRADAIRSERDPATGAVRWLLAVEMSDGEGDSRANMPSIKTAQSIRQIPVSAETAEVLLTYVENYRGRVKHPYLISSARRSPLSIAGVTKLMQNLSTALSTEARIELKGRTGTETVTAHALRHTSAVVRMKQLLARNSTTDQAMMHLRSFFGWSKTSVMPLHYAKTALDERLSEVWEDKFDTRLDLLRSLAQ